MSEEFEPKGCTAASQYQSVGIVHGRKPNPAIKATLEGAAK